MESATVERVGKKFSYIAVLGNYLRYLRSCRIEVEYEVSQRFSFDKFERNITRLLK